MKGKISKTTTTEGYIASKKYGKRLLVQVKVCKVLTNKKNLKKEPSHLKK